MHNEYRDLLITLLGRLGGNRVRNLDAVQEDMSDTPFADVHRPDIRVDEPGCAPTFIDVSLAHWWSGGRGRTSEARREAAAATPTAVVDAAHRHKLVEEYRQEANVWPGCLLILGIVATGGRAHGDFAGSIRGWCRRAAERRGGIGGVDVDADFQG